MATTNDMVFAAKSEDMILVAQTASGAIRFANGAAGSDTEKMTIASTGNVGIGTTSPATALE